MASTQLGDIPGARFHVPQVMAHASVASDGANARVGQIGPFPHNIRVRSAFWTPTDADQTGHGTSYRKLTLYNGGAAGTATATSKVIASLGITASKASLAPVAMVVDTTVTLSAGEVIYASHETVGGAKNTETILRAGQFALGFEVI